MEGIILTDDDLNILEKRWGPDSREMGPWITDGTFGYCWVSLAVLENVAECIENPYLIMAVLKLKDASDRIEPFIALLEGFGRPLVERIVAAYRQGSLEARSGTPVTKKPAERQASRAMAAAR